MSNKLKFILISTLLAAGILSGCYYDNEEDLYQYYYDAVGCDTANVSFSADIFPLFQANCNTPDCHVAGGTGTGLFENYNQIKDKVDNGSLMEQVVVLQTMPPSAPLSDCSTSLLEAWINDGALNN